MQRAIRNIAILSMISLVGHGLPARAQGFDGQWQGTYSCGPHRLLPMGAFTWSIAFEIKNGRVSRSHNYIGGTNKNPATAIFNGTINDRGVSKIDVITDRNNPTEMWHQQLLGSSISPTVINLIGAMLRSDSTLLRDCQLTLRLALPALPAAVARRRPPDRRRATTATPRGSKASDRNPAPKSRRIGEARRRREARGCRTGTKGSRG
jgi:hypothetical protein